MEFDLPQNFENEKRSPEHSREYIAVLRSERWARLKAFMVEKCEGACQRCKGTDVPLELHHRNYKRLGAEQPFDDVWLLCPDCHKLADEKRKEDAERRKNRFRSWRKKRRW